MADETVVREELWFDSADGTSRIHGYVWWPLGILDPADISESASVQVANPSEQETPQYSSTTDEDHRAAHASNDVFEKTGDSRESAPRHAGAPLAQGSTERDQSALDTLSEAKVPSVPASRNALEAAAQARSIAAITSNDSGESSQLSDHDEQHAPDSAADDLRQTDRNRESTHSESDSERGLHDEASENAKSEVDTEQNDAIEVKGIVQLVHGMSEHIGRYDEFACYLAENGYIVCGHDHIGHGLSATSERLGCIPARNGKDLLVEDVGRLRSIMQDRVGNDLPYFLFGHSLGSFVVRAYIAREGEGLAGAIICGTGHVPPLKSSMGYFFSRFIALIRGQNFKSRLLHSMGVGAYAKSVKHMRTTYDWLSYNESNVDAYRADELCGFRFSAGGYATVTSLTKEVCTHAWASRIPRLLPLLFIGGNADPVGDSGEGVRISTQLVRDAGCADVTCMIYKRMRHEILNEDDRETVFDDVLFWLEVRS